MMIRKIKTNGIGTRPQIILGSALTGMNRGNRILLIHEVGKRGINKMKQNQEIGGVKRIGEEE